MKNIKTENPTQRAIQTENVSYLCELYFGIELTEGQDKLVKKIAFEKKGRLSICCMTRYGKSFCVALGIALYIILNENKKIAFIAPTKDQAGILRDYMAELISVCPELSNISDLEYLSEPVKNRADKLKKEASKNRVTFKNGCEYRIFTANLEGKSLMGFGVGSSGGKIIKDEATLLSDESQTKISRMVGDNPEKTQEIELFNPWERENKAFEHYNSSNWETVHIEYNQAIKEGRTTKQFIEEQREELTPLEFQVLYESRFPEQSEDSIFSLTDIENAINKKLDLEEEYKRIKEKAKEPFKYSEREFKKIKEENNKFNKVISCDVADKGLDETVIFWGYQKGNSYQIKDHYSEPKSENMNIAGRIKNTIKEFGKGERVIVKIDSIGVGSGVVSRLKELKDEENLNIEIVECHSGERAVDKERFLNKKAENYFRIKKLIEKDNLDILNVGKLKNQLINMKWKFNSAGKIQIEDPKEKSPDWCFTGETLITTINGDKQIKNIQKGEKVLTPFGFREVKAKSKRKVDKILKTTTKRGRVIKSTPNHKIYTNESFKKAEQLEYNNALEENKLKNLIKWRIKNILNITEKNTGFREQADTSTGIFGKKGTGKRKHFTDRFGKTIINKKFLKDLLSTTLMEIPLIIRLKILNLLKTKNIKRNTILKDLKIQFIKKISKETYKKLKKKQKNGTKAQKEENGIKNNTKNLLQKYQKENSSALTVGKNITHQEKKKRGSVQENATSNTKEKKKFMESIKNVFGVVKNIGKSLNIQKDRPVHQAVQHSGESGINVYNLTVDRDNVYYANGILVSNCDALNFFIWKGEEFNYGFVDF